MTKIALIGAGPMAQSYGHAFRALSRDCVVIGRGQSSAETFEQTVGLPVLTGGLEANIAQLSAVSHAIVALPVPALAQQTLALMEAGVRNILVEKPAGLNVEEINRVAAMARKTASRVYVAYNRRFYASVQTAKRRIEADGGATSFRFEISEWADRIGPSAQPDNVKAAWFLANSTHVVDMAFFLGGFPKTISASSAGSVGWHTPSVFVGHGETQDGALFSYHGDWGASPRWMVEVCTAGHTYMFQPLEGLKVRTKAGFAIEEIALDPVEDTAPLKPGVKAQTEAFLSDDVSSDLLSIEDHLSHVRNLYDFMSGHKV